MRSLPHLSRATVITVALAGTLGAAAAGSSAAFGSAGPDRVTVANAQPAVSSAKVTGTPSGSEKIEVKLYLANRDAAGLAALVSKVSTPGTSSYGTFSRKGSGSSIFSTQKWSDPNTFSSTWKDSNTSVRTSWTEVDPEEDEMGMHVSIGTKLNRVSNRHSTHLSYGGR